MKDYHVVLPPENGCIVKFTQEGMPGIANIRSTLRDFEPKIVFAWHLSVMLQSEQVVENGMPPKAEQRVLDGCYDALDSAFKGPDAAKPNALVLARITWNATQELVYRVYEPAPIDAYLRRLIDERSFSREFDYRMDHDPEWKLTEWHLRVSKA